MKKSLKSVAILATLILALVTLTGCMNINFDVKLDKKGAGDVSYTMGYQKSVIEGMGASVEDIKNQDTTLEESQKPGKEEGYTVEEYEDDTIYGYKASKHYDNIAEFSMSKILELGEEANDKITFEKNGSKVRYSQNAEIDLKALARELGVDDNAEGSEAAMMKSIINQMKMTYKITLPFKAGNNNATTVSKDGKTLEWELKMGELNTIQFEAEDTGVNMFLVLGILVAILAVIIVVAVLASKKSNNKPSNESANVEPELDEPVKENEPIKEAIVEEIEEIKEDLNVEEDPIKEEPTEGNNEE